MTLFLVICIAAAMLMLVSGVLMFVRSGDHDKSSAILERLEVGDDGESTELGSLLSGKNTPIIGGVIALMQRAGVDAKPRSIVLGAALIFGLAVVFAIAINWLAGLLVAGLLLLVVYVVLWRKSVKRRQLIIDQIPDFLESATRVLSAGNTLEESIAAASSESPEPLHGLFVSINRQVRLGAPMDQVLAQAARLHGIRDLGVMALTISINRRYGGGVRNVLRGLIGAIRQRGTANRELRALTGETRFSALVLGTVSIGLLVYMYLVNPKYYAHMIQTTMGLVLLLGAIAWLVIGVFVLWRMVNSIGDSE